MNGSKARTERSRVGFSVKEFADGTPWIMLDQSPKDMPSLKDAFIGFDLPKGATLAKAQQISDFMNEHLMNVSVTIFDTHPLYDHKK